MNSSPDNILFCFQKKSEVYDILEHSSINPIGDLCHWKDETKRIFYFMDG